MKSVVSVLPKTTRYRLKQGPRHARIADHYVAQRFMGQYKATHRAVGDHGCHPWAQVDHRDLAEEVTWATPRYRPSVANDLRFAFQDHEQGSSLSALTDDDLVSLEVTFVRTLRNLAYLPSREPREEW